MIHSYAGSYPYNKDSISRYASDNFGVYYCGYMNGNTLATMYVGRAAGDGVSIKSRLLNHLSNDYWPKVTHFGFHVCDTKSEAIDLEAREIERLQPPYNTQGK